MKKVSVVALGFALALVALAPAASAQGMILDPDGVRGAWASLTDWFASVFGDTGPAMDPWG